MHVDDVYNTSAFSLLAQGMKDREAFDIVLTLLLSASPDVFGSFERWCREEMAEQIAADAQREEEV